MMGYRVKDETIGVSEFSNHQYGISLSGPIIKNKLFFFINGEMDRQEEPISYTTANSAADATVLQGLSDFLGDELGYNPGKFDVNKTNTQADRITARLDWNINSNNVLSLKYYYLKSFNTNNPSTSGAPNNGRGPNAFAIPFSSSFYRTNNNFNIWMADLNTTINDRMSNYLKIGYSRLRDYRDMDGGYFPQVDILDGDNNAYTTFGTEANSYNNQLNSDIWQIQDNFLMNFGKHQITVGTQSDYRAFKNGFAQNYPGSCVFNSVDDFKFNVLATKQYMAAHNGSVQGFDIRVLSSNAIWICLNCENCIARCPKEINIPKVMDYLRERSRKERCIHKESRPVVAFHSAFLESVKRTGRLYEVGLVAGFKARTLRLTQDLNVAHVMFVKGKLNLFPERVKDENKIKKIFAQTIEKTQK